MIPALPTPSPRGMPLNRRGRTLCSVARSSISGGCFFYARGDPCRNPQMWMVLYGTHAMLNSTPGSGGGSSDGSSEVARRGREAGRRGDLANKVSHESGTIERGGKGSGSNELLSSANETCRPQVPPSLYPPLFDGPSPVFIFP